MIHSFNRGQCSQTWVYASSSRLRGLWKWGPNHPVYKACWSNHPLFKACWSNHPVYKACWCFTDISPQTVSGISQGVLYDSLSTKIEKKKTRWGHGHAAREGRWLKEALPGPVFCTVMEKLHVSTILGIWRYSREQNITKGEKGLA